MKTPEQRFEEVVAYARGLSRKGRLDRDGWLPIFFGGDYHEPPWSIGDVPEVSHSELVRWCWTVVDSSLASCMLLVFVPRRKTCRTRKRLARRAAKRKERGHDHDH